MTPPLAGLRVLDVTQVMAGPFCCQVLGDLGADVVKVEPPDRGDQSRRSMGFSMKGEDTAAFLAVNRNKRSAALNLKDAAHRDAFHRVAAGADVLVENFRPGVTARLGIDYDTLSQINPGMVYASISGFGQTGPYAMRPGFDLIAQGVSGVMSVTGEPGGEPVKCGIPVSDLAAGLGFNAVSEKARAASAGARLPRSYWDWRPILEANRAGFWPYTSATNLLYGLRESLAMLGEEGLPAVFARHLRHAAATRRAVEAWGLEVLCADPREYSPVLTAVVLPDDYDADEVRRVILERFDMSLGTGLGKLQGRVFRIGHLGHFNDLMLAGTLCGVEMGLRIAGVPVERGVEAALDSLESELAAPESAA